MYLKTITAAAVAGLVSTGTASADTIVKFEFTGGVMSATQSDSNVTISGITRGAGIIASADNVSNGVYRIKTNATDGSFNTNENDYIEFTITPDAGYELNLLQFQGKFGVDENSSNIFNLRSSLDSFGSTIGGSFNTPSGNTTLYDRSRDLSGAAFQGLDSAITFRIYTNSNNARNDKFQLFDDLEITGSVIPEPGSLALLGLGGLCLLSGRGKRRDA